MDAMWSKDKISPNFARSYMMHGRGSYSSKLNSKVVRSAWILVNNGPIKVLNFNMHLIIYAFEHINRQLTSLKG